MSAHFMSSDRAIGIANAIRNMCIAGEIGEKGWDDISLRDINSDDVIHFYDVAIEFFMHTEFIDSCAFDSIIEMDSPIEYIRSHKDIRTWDANDFANHFAFEKRQMHHYASLSMNPEIEMTHDRTNCVMCNPNEDTACCAFDKDAFNNSRRNIIRNSSAI